MKKLWFVLSIICIVLLAVFATLKESSIHRFPVPVTAQVVEEGASSSITYEFIGINQLYAQHVKLLGWQEVERMGSQGIFEKDGKRVALTTFKDGFRIVARNNE